MCRESDLFHHSKTPRFEAQALESGNRKALSRGWGLLRGSFKARTRRHRGETGARPGHGTKSSLWLTGDGDLCVPDRCADGGRVGNSRRTRRAHQPGREIRPRNCELAPAAIETNLNVGRGCQWGMAQNSRGAAIKSDFSGNDGDGAGLALRANHEYTSGVSDKGNRTTNELPGKAYLSGISTLFSTING